MLALTNLKRLESLCLMEAVSLRWCPLVVFTLTFFVLVVLSLIHATDVLCGLYGRHARSLPEPSEPSVRTGRDAAHVTTTTAASNSFPHNLNPHSCNIAIFSLALAFDTIYTSLSYNLSQNHFYYTATQFWIPLWCFGDTWNLSRLLTEIQVIGDQGDFYWENDARINRGRRANVMLIEE